MPTVQEVLRQSGFTQEQIDAMDAKALNTFGTMVTSAETDRSAAAAAQARAEADLKAAHEATAKAEAERKAAIEERERIELVGRSNTEFYETKIVPGLTGWDEEKTRLENERVQALAQAAFYRTQNEGAKAGGFIPADAPGYVAPKVEERDGQGRYVPGGVTPGSPVFDSKVLIKNFSDGAAMLSNIEWKYRKLYDGVMPIAPSQLIAEADAQKLSPEAYAEKRFNFSAREMELTTQRQREHEAKIAADASAAKDAEWDAKMKAQEAVYLAKEKQRAEQSGNNPDVRMPAGSSKFVDIKRAVEANERPNPLKMTDAQRHAATTKAIHSEIQEREGVAV